MKAWPAWLAGSLAALAVARCGGSPPPRAAHDPGLEPAPEIAPGAAGAGTEPAPAEPERRHVDPDLVKKALDRTASSVGDAAETHGLRFELVENGPRSGWAFAVLNRGSETMRVVLDPSLLTLEILPPADPKARRGVKSKPRVCRLPAELRAERASNELTVVLAPGHGIVEAFDPRLYCLPEQGVSPFVAGARLSARFGFSPKTKVVYKGGRHEEPLAEQPPPFVATVAPPEAPNASHEEPADAGAPVAAADAAPPPSPPDVAVQGVKELVATPLELGPDYAPPPPSTPTETLELELTQGSDAVDFAGATVTLRLANHEKRARRIYFRREFVSFQVTGPDGTVTCDPEPDGRAPDRQAFTLLAPGGSISVTSRLAELCPDDTFLRPGLYVVEGQLDAFAAGEEYAYDAFVGKLVSNRAVVVRVRRGTLPFPGPRVSEPVRVGAP